ncbi:uncharacterized protein LOC106773017 [Vigna radiata var. radiata]|uniref:Uncharacterized protein LOC106773017 n=1 Tax=Vigna radiata var. radiata TaxID=3916 RepID=A0A3Q0FDU5_VIGRR|nr:uncharacterized protein LOC106773017 [Vigna radiata var. radiata]XP_022641821.1 uncharacterized protein LOC106773017 [Vigna radiata var. radiata]
MFYPSKTASKAITATIKQQFDKPWLTWRQIPNTDKGVFFESFKKKVSWKIEDEGKVKRNFHFKASHRLAKMFKKARKEGKKPNWMGDNVWNGLLEKWNMPLYRQKSDMAKKNRTSEKGGNLHIGGSISVNDHAIHLSQDLGRSVHVDEICQQTHIHCSTKEFIDERSRRTHEEFQTRFSRVISETASVVASTSSPLDPAEEERLRNRCRLEAASGRYKGRVYDIGNVNIQDDCVNSYIRQTQASPIQQSNAEVLHNLKMQIASQEQQLRHMTSRWQGFIGAIIQFLPPPAVAVAQQFLQHQINEQKSVPQNDVQAQDQPADQP